MSLRFFNRGFSAGVWFRVPPAARPLAAAGSTVYAGALLAAVKICRALRKGPL